MTIDTKNLRALAEDCMQREIDFDDVSPNQGSTSCDKLVRAYIAATNPAIITHLLDALERKDRLLRTALKSLLKERQRYYDNDATEPEQIKDAIASIAKELTR